MSKSLGLIDGGGRLTAWNLIIKNELFSLPVNPFVVAAKNNVQALTYQQLAENTRNSVEFYELEYNRTAFAYKLNNRYCIAYNAVPQAKKEELRWNIAHELCHIFLGHVVEEGCCSYSLFDNMSNEEVEADKLARRLLAPSIILHMCGCTSAREIGKLCGIPKDRAAQRFEHLQDLRLRDAFLMSEQERDIAIHFMDFISSYLVSKHT